MKFCRQCKNHRELKFFQEKRNGKIIEYKQCDIHRHYDRTRPKRIRSVEENYKYNSRRKKNAEDNKNRALKRGYNINLIQYMEMFKKQNGVCKICKEKEKRIDPRTKQPRWLAVDHCHLGDHVRGLLCGDCNVGIGLLRESTFILSNAIKYLRDDDEKIFNSRG